MTEEPTKRTAMVEAIDAEWPAALERLRHTEPGTDDQGIAIVGSRDLEMALTRLDQFADVALGNAMEVSRLSAENLAMREALNTPELDDFAAGVVSEAQHQRQRYAADHDAGKGPLDWFWLIGYLAQKAVTAAQAGDTGKAKHHTISTAAACANWHARLMGANSDMRPGVDPVARGFAGVVSVDEMTDAESAESLLSAAREYVADALEAHDHSDGRELLSKIDAAIKVASGL